MIEPGVVLDERYKLIRTLGEGGMANVYLARDLILDRDVAVKVLRLDLQDDPDTLRRFQREAHATSELVHPNIVAIYDVGEASGQQYLVMEYVQGTDLKKYIVEHFPIPYQRVVEIMTQVLSAVQAAHDHNIIHRDLKPQNILIAQDGTAKISDFGIAVALSDNSMTQTNSLLGSVHYLSPEQARGGMPTKQSDIYALGIILFEMLTGTVPFEGDSAVAIALKHFQEDMPSVRDFDPRIPQALENVVIKATAKDPLNRYTSADAMASDLRTALSPARAHEEKYVPPVASDLDETKIIPAAAAAAAATTPATPVEAATKDDSPVSPVKKVLGNKAKWKRRLPFIIAGVVAAALIGLLIAAFVGGPSDTTVPDLRGMTTTQAKSALSNSNLKLGKITKQSSAKVAKNRIIKSDPAQNTDLKEDSKVDIVISKGVKKFTLKDYVGQDYDDVKKDLEDRGFTVSKLETTSDTAPSGQITDQDIAAGKKVVPGDTTITFTVSSGSSKFAVANLVGNYTESSARDYAETQGLTLKVNSEYDDDVAKGMVSQQRPAPGTMLARGDTLTITVSKGVDPSKAESNKEVTIQDLTGFGQNLAQRYADDNGLKLAVTDDYSDTVAKGQVASQSPAKGTKLKPGETINVVISKGPKTTEESSSSSSD
ncbi:Stk1 family PASTA domain-containing Ser/Thr kinase [Lacticaseibacillus nasuensis]|uniref:Stk1 family PASTA domain-containing Ser/Thr kinase n=1 Tax=Lacticaseibacillus nasuensis TaxID=944671 RepID=UPI002AFE8DFB|nr:Stk1 family PASTA domain-containing Ser/Thr kinase [Lacticaseibacillus nasuensis]